MLCSSPKTSVVTPTARTVPSARRPGVDRAAAVALARADRRARQALVPGKERTILPHWSAPLVRPVKQTRRPSSGRARPAHEPRRAEEAALDDGRRRAAGSGRHRQDERVELAARERGEVAAARCPGRSPAAAARRSAALRRRVVPRLRDVPAQCAGAQPAGTGAAAGSGTPTCRRAAPLGAARAGDERAGARTRARGPPSSRRGRAPRPRRRIRSAARPRVAMRS